jgi:hypothetical protein
MPQYIRHVCRFGVFASSLLTEQRDAFSPHALELVLQNAVLDAQSKMEVS